MWARQAARRAPFEPELRAQLADPAHHVLVGTVDDVVMGYGVARTEVLPDGGRLGVVTDLYTEPGARELGIGEVMMDGAGRLVPRAGLLRRRQPRPARAIATPRTSSSPSAWWPGPSSCTAR